MNVRHNLCVVQRGGGQRGKQGGRMLLLHAVAAAADAEDAMLVPHTPPGCSWRPPGNLPGMMHSRVTGAVVVDRHLAVHEPLDGGVALHAILLAQLRLLGGVHLRGGGKQEVWGGTGLNSGRGPPEWEGLSKPRAGVSRNAGQGMTAGQVILRQRICRGGQWPGGGLVALHGHSALTLAMTMVGSTSFSAVAALLYSGSSFCGAHRAVVSGSWAAPWGRTARTHLAMAAPRSIELHLQLRWGQRPRKLLHGEKLVEDLTRANLLLPTLSLKLAFVITTTSPASALESDLSSSSPSS